MSSSTFVRTDLTSVDFVQVEPSCSITGEGLDSALEILHQLIQKRKKMAKRNRNKTK
jgi:hypothetical protein